MLDPLYKIQQRINEFKRQSQAPFKKNPNGEDDYTQYEYNGKYYPVGHSLTSILCHLRCSTERVNTCAR